MFASSQFKVYAFCNVSGDAIHINRNFVEHLTFNLIV